MQKIHDRWKENVHAQPEFARFIHLGDMPNQSLDNFFIAIGCSAGPQRQLGGLQRQLRPSKAAGRASQVAGRPSQAVGRQ